MKRTLEFSRAYIYVFEIEHDRTRFSHRIRLVCHLRISDWSDSQLAM
jgi:hypothetical protein